MISDIYSRGDQWRAMYHTLDILGATYVTTIADRIVFTETLQWREERLHCACSIWQTVARHCSLMLVEKQLWSY